MIAVSRDAVLVAHYSIEYAGDTQGIGGPAQGYKHLVDSSLDWGQVRCATIL